MRGKIGLPEVNLGVLPGTGGTQRLSRLVGKSKAIELMVTGNTFSFEEALEFGIINDIYERESFMESVMEYVINSARRNKAAKAVGRIKRAVQTGWRFQWNRRWPWSGRTSSIVPERRRKRGPGRICREASRGVYREMKNNNHRGHREAQRLPAYPVTLRVLCGKRF